MMFNPDQLLEEAHRKTGLTNFGNAPLHDGLEVLCRALATEARLNEAGRNVAMAELVGLLEVRLNVEEAYRNQPEIERQKIVAPLMVTGLPRSGTTALSQMLAQDPTNRSIRRWEAAMPVPPPSPLTDRDDPRFADMQRKLDERYKLTPRMMAINPVAAGDPTENLCFLKLTLRSQHFGGFYQVPSYMEWLASVDMKPSYEYLKRVLKLLQLKYPDHMRWNLKYPLDLNWLSEIQSVFPDAHIIWTHRDPVKTIPSALSFITTMREPLVDGTDKEALIKFELDQVDMVRRAMAYRERPNALPILDLYNVDLVQDPERTIENVYKHAGISYSAEFDAALRRRNLEKPKGRFGSHNYSLADFGLSDTQIRDAFEFYTSAMAIPLGK